MSAFDVATSSAPQNRQRRQFVIRVLGTALGIRALAACSPSSSDAEPEWLLRLAGDQQATALIGAQYLSQAPEEHDIALLTQRLRDALAAHLQQVDPSALSTQVLLTGLQSLMQQEFADGDVVMVDDWLLSRSEARLYGVVTLAAR